MGKGVATRTRVLRWRIASHVNSREYRVLLCVSVDVHHNDEYDPHPRVCHRAFGLSAAGNVD